MAGWLSSKLKVAEQFLQQIDQQAAESLKRSDHETPLAFPFMEDNPKVPSQNIISSNKNQYAKSAGVLPPEQGYFSSAKTNAQQSLSNLRKNSGLYNDQPSLNKMDLDGQKAGTRKLGLASPAEQIPAKSSKEDWTELLASPDLIGNFSASRASSVGSSDFGMSSTVRGVPSRSPFYSGKAPTNGAPSASSIVPHTTKQQSRPSSVRPSPFQNQPTEKFSSDAAAGNEKFQGDPVRRYLNLDENSGQNGNFEFQDVLLEDAESSTEEGQSSRSRKRQVDPDKYSCTVDSRIDETPYSGEELFLQGLPDFKKSEKHADIVETQQSEVESLELTRSTLLNKDKNGKTDSENHPVHSSLDHVIIPTEQQLVGFTLVRTHGLGQIASPSEVENLVHVNVSKAPVRENIEDLGKDDVTRNKNSLEIFSMQSAENLEHDVAIDTSIPHSSILPDNGLGNEPGSSRRGQNVTKDKDRDSDTETETDSDTDSDYEENLHRLTAEKRRLVERKTAELAAGEAAKAALREREEFIKRLEKEKESLEHALAEREEKQAKEAEDLQTGMTELIEAVELEKQRHTTTRMESLAKEAKLEAENAQLAKTLAAAQRNLDRELSHLIQVRSKVDAQKVAKADLERKIAKLNSWISLSQMPPQAGEADYGFVAEEKTEILLKINDCKMQDLEEKLANAKNVQQTPTDVEIELEHRLNQLTEHLIQKQAQVEELSTEKATLVFRLETLSNLLQDQGSPLASHSTNRKKAGVSDWSSMDEDLEYGASKFYSSKYKVSTNNRDDLHRNVLTKALINPHMLDGFYRRIDSLFLGGAHILRMHKLARALAGFYLLALHCWVLFILLMHSNSSREGSSIANSSTVLNSADSINVLNATRAS
ncbi:hypothetical protein O6H91_11G071600 [Diphasiastrum complanatum]|uniref:Uncharacterized protein n=1 Tax=Diphasiastrum complanatum TaxID=34168 RepID=A0ACC2CAD6_DIPCM|nr:hypothetical protein O6H91_11G071600 [Diphasiastrum complanatum]